MWVLLLLAGGAYVVAKKRATKVTAPVPGAAGLKSTTKGGWAGPAPGLVPEQWIQLPYLPPGAQKKVGPFTLIGLPSGAVMVKSKLWAVDWTSPPDRRIPKGPPKGTSEDGGWAYVAGAWVWARLKDKEFWGVSLQDAYDVYKAISSWF